MKKMDCLFCKIVENEIPSKKVYEDDLVVAFLDIKPNSPGHTVLIPKKHFVCLDDIDDNTLNYIMKVSRKLKKRLEKKLNCDGITIVQNNGDVQDIKHYHIHLIPHYKTKKDKTIEE